jgi:hypothetical protein
LSVNALFLRIQIARNSVNLVVKSVPTIIVGFARFGQNLLEIRHIAFYPRNAKVIYIIPRQKTAIARLFV